MLNMKGLKIKKDWQKKNMEVNNFLFNKMYTYDETKKKT